MGGLNMIPANPIAIRNAEIINLKKIIKYAT
jgi:hypothetical protein